MTTYLWEKNDGGGWVPFEGTPTIQNPTEDFAEGTWSIRATVTEGSESGEQTRTGYIEVTAAEEGYEGPLDLVPGAVVAYGVRALSAAMLGQNIFRLRRDSDDVEMDFAADAVTGEAPIIAITAWLNGSSGYLVTLYDQGGSAINITNSSPGTQLEWLGSLLNGKPGFIPSGVGVTYGSSVDANLPDGQLTIFSVCRQGLYFGMGDHSEFIYGELRLAQDVGPVVEIYNDTTGSDAGGQTDTADNSIKLYSASCAFGSRYLEIDGATQTFASVFDAIGVSPSFSKPVFLQDADLGLQFCEGIIYPDIVTGAAKTSVNQNIATYYGISLP